jgi:pyruvate kinase
VSKTSRRTKIITTIGPSSRDERVLRALLEAGVDVIRLNFAHDVLDAHKKTAELARGLARDLGKVVGVMVDLPGPKMRTGPIRDEELELVAGQRFVLTGDDVEGDAEKVSTTVEGLAGFVSKGDAIFLADGQIVLQVVSEQGEDVITEVVRPGILRSRKGMHLPHAEDHVKAFTPEDEIALQGSVELEADLVGLSFVRDANDMQRARAALPEHGHRPRLVAKIETASAVANLAAIVPEADAVMVARGDLGIQTPLRRVPLLQKEIIKTCNEWGRPVITATQMLESMTSATLPTRAEVADVANAVLDGTDALMLSEETAVGHDPVGVYKMMADVAQSAETALGQWPRPVRKDARTDAVSWAVCRAAVRAAEELGVAAILCPTRTGSTPRRVATSRPSMPIVALSADLRTLGPLGLAWGVVPLHLPETPVAYGQKADVERVTRAAMGAGLVSPGDLVAVVAGSEGPRAGSTDFVRIVGVQS